MFSEKSEDHEVEVIAVEGAIKDWTAYVETPNMPFHDTAAYGDKLPQSVAERLFPSWAKWFTWRP